MEQVNFIRLDPFYSVRFPDGEFTVPANPFEYETELIRRFPDEADGIRQLIDAMVKTYYEVRRFSADGELNRRPPMAEMPAVYPNMLKAMATTWGDFMAEYLSDAKVKAVFTTLWAYYGLPPSQLPAAAFIFPWVSYHLFGGYYPEGGSMAMSRALEATVKKYGGEIRYRQTVKRIEIQDGKAVAVETEQGLRAEAEVIISNANAPDTMLKFVGRENLPQKYVRQVEKPKAAASNVVVYLALNRDLRAEWPHHEFFVSDGYDIEAGYAGMMAGDFEKVDFGVSLYNLLDPGCAPEGGSVLVLTTLADWDYAEQWGTGGKLENYQQNPHYLELKEDAADKLIRRTEELIPGLREAIVYQEVATPLTNHRFTRNPGGSIYGSEQTMDNMYLNRLKDKTPIPNLFLAGAWTFGGGQSAAMMSGHNAARRAQGYLGGETEDGKETRRQGELRNT